MYIHPAQNHEEGITFLLPLDSLINGTSYTLFNLEEVINLLTGIQPCKKFNAILFLEKYIVPSKYLMTSKVLFTIHFAVLTFLSKSFIHDILKVYVSILEMTGSFCNILEYITDKQKRHTIKDHFYQTNKAQQI